jgi:pimeloyl-ACP methyl ester carboxylesterase
MERFVRTNGLELWCETFGDAGDPAIVLIMGIGTSGVAWDDELCTTLAGAGHQVIRFDHRDTGLSSRVDFEANPYTLTDMADDVAGLLDATGIDAANIVGASLGGMVAQEFALAHSARTVTLTLMITTPTIIDEAGRFLPDDLPPMQERLVATMVDLAVTPVTTRDGRLDAAVTMARELMGSRYRASDAEVRAAKARELDRMQTHFGEDSAEYRSAIIEGDSSRSQSRAVANSRDRIPLLPTVTAPTLVISGDEDPFFGLAHGRRLAELIPGARFVAVTGLGHTPPLPAELAPMLLDHIASAG